MWEIAEQQLQGAGERVEGGLIVQRMYSFHLEGEKSSKHEWLMAAQQCERT